MPTQTPDSETLPPYSADAEAAVLGSMMSDERATAEVISILVPEAFYRGPHQVIYETMMDLSQQKEPLDVITVSEHLRKRGHLEKVGGHDYIFELYNKTVSSISTNAASYARTVHESYRRRQLIEAASAIVELAYDESEDFEDVLSGSEEALFKAAIDRVGDGPRHMREIIREMIDRTEAARDGEMPGLSTGFLDLDRTIGGLNKSDLILVGARPGMGKTAFMKDIALQAAMEHGARVAIWALEMSGVQMATRFTSSRTKIDSQRISRGQLAENEWPLFLNTAGKIAETNIWLDDTPHLKPSQLRARARRLYLDQGLDLIVVDYLQLMDSDLKYTDSRVSQVSQISRALKLLARELDIPVMVASQLNRQLESRQDKRPQLADLRDSGTLEQDADIVLFIYRDEYYNPETTDRPNIAEIEIAKHRNGPTGLIDLYWHGKLARFRNLKRKSLDLNGKEPTQAALSGEHYG